MTTSKNDTTPAKVIVNSRVPPSAVADLDTIAKLMKPQPTRSELVALAIEEFIDRRKPKSKGKS